MPCLPINYEVIVSATQSHNPSKPIYMLNLWRYRETASYGPEHTHLAGNPCTGREAMGRYRSGLKPLLPPGASVHFMGTTIAHVVAAEGEQWDVVALVKYESAQAFLDMVRDERYVKDVEPHRLAALDDFRLVMVDLEM